MSGTYLTNMATWLRNAGLNVIEQAGWQSRARGSGGYASGRPWCIMWHHTASNPSSDGQSDVNYIITAQDAPLSNLYINRAGTVWVIAAGATNTNGKGGPYSVSRGQIPADSMNTYAVGIEVANNGVGEAWPAAQVNAFFAVSIALSQALGLRPDDICSHTVWAPGRKIDPAQAASVQGSWKPRSVNSSGSWNLDDIKAECRARANGVLPPTPNPIPESDDVEVVEVKATGANAVFLGMRSRQTTTAIDGTTAPRVFVLWVEWVNGFDALQLNRLNSYRNMGVPVQELSLSDFVGLGLIGPIPTGDALHNWTASDFGNVITA